MRFYQSYGLCIDSEIRLPGFVARDCRGEADVRILRRQKPPSGWRIRNDYGMHVTGVAQGIMHFKVIGGKEIVVDILPDADLDYARAIISGELVAVLLRQRGLLVLHASCVARDGEAIGFVGYSGWGKSTMAAHFLEHGYQLVCDDVLAIDFSSRRSVVIPGYPLVKLRGDTGRKFDGAFDQRPVAHSLTEKRLVDLGERSARERTSLHSLYLLEGCAREINRVVPIKGPPAFEELLKHTRAANLLKDDYFREIHLKQLVALLQTVSVRVLERPRSLDLIAETCELIEKDLSSGNDGAGEAQH